MEKAWFACCFWWISAVSLAAEPQGVWEAQMHQGELERLSAAWSPSPSAEARWWWRTDAGGSGWVRWQGWQLGPLVPVAGREGTRNWGPSYWASSGRWGSALSTEYGGLWAVENPDTFEAGFQLQRPGTWFLAAGAERTWNLGPEAAVADRGRAGVSWSVPGWSAGLEGEASKDDSWAGQLSARAGAGRDGFEGEVRGKWSGDWNARVRAGWSRKDFLVAAFWDRDEGSEIKARAGLRAWGRLWSLEGQADYAGSWKPLVTALAEGREGPGRWTASWAVRPLERVQTLVFCWDEPLFDFEARWRVRGGTLGWIGPGETFDLVWRWRV